MPAAEVGYIVAQPADISFKAEAAGRLTPYRSADVRARVPGIVQRRLYDEGSDVRAGQVLFRIDPAQLQADSSAAQAALARAQAEAANATANAARARKLAPGKFISKNDLDAALAAERSANAAVQQARAALQGAQINQGYATVRAPISGRAGIQQVTEGALVGQGTATLLTTVDQIDPLYVEFSVGGNELTRLRQAGDGGGSSDITVILPDGSAYAHTAKLDYAGNVVNPATGAVKLRAVVPNPERLLMPGTFVTVRASLAEQKGAFRIPQTAVLRDAQGPYVLVVDAQGKAARKGLPEGRQEGADYIVDGGLAAGDKVIVSGLQRVQQPGQPVKGVPADAPKPAAKQG
ncbi:efflux RND transporter periplasmic adaptor subunit [Lysobacter soyae]|uniref:Efflux RND transporter periplasmic adaptor subunit n=2 Tax=Lysobacter soyae TaxID=2764185 RepID=A0ABX8WST5_9GAMM|nr:efflux RND transporter periplasmic adaptor subunit [Lysobacter sp. CJ11]